MKKINLKKPQVFCLVSFIIILLLETFVFNASSFYLLGKNSEAYTLPLKDNYSFTQNLNGTLTSIENTASTLEFDDINKPVNTIFIDLTCSGEIVDLKTSIDFIESTSRKYRTENASMTIINGNKKSMHTTCQFSGDIKSLRLTFEVPTDATITINSIKINERIPFHFSIMRVLLLFGIATLAYLLINSDILKNPHETSKRFTKFITIGLTVILIMLSLLTTISNKDFMSNDTNQMTQELVDAFEAGQVSLVEKPSEELLSLDNPYDRAEREFKSVAYLWDHCLYEGNYYSYYGIAPVVFLFLPYHIITGSYFSTTDAVFIFAAIGIILLTKLYMLIIKKWFPRLPLNFLIMGLIIIQFSSGIWFSLARPMFYEIAISSGFACVLAGACFLISSNVVGDGKLSHWRLFGSATFLSLAVLCRPTLAVYCVAALLFVFFGLKKVKGNAPKTIKYLLCSLMPFAFFGSIQMIYNYLRFNSIFDFGIEYSLTINDFTSSQFHIAFVFLSLFAFLFAMPSPTTHFPFVSSQFNNLNVNGFYYVDDGLTDCISIGLFFRALPMFFYMFAMKAYRIIGKSKEVAVLFVSTCIVAPLIIISSVWESGYAIRYNADFSWQMIIGALLIAFVLITAEKNERVLKITAYFFTFATFMCILVNFAQVYSFLSPKYIDVNTQIAFNSFARLFEFWL